MSPKCQFWTIFLSAFFTLNLIYFFKSSPDPTVFQSQPASSTLQLVTDQTTLKFNQEFSISVNYSLTQPVQFIQALLEYDPLVIKPILPDEKLHSLPYHKTIAPAGNQLRMTANSINPLKPFTNLSTLKNNGSIAKIKFKVISLKKTTTQIKFITNLTDQTDWNSTNIIYLDRLLSPVQLLLHSPSPLILTLIPPASSSPSPSPSFSPSPSPSPSPSFSPSFSPSSSPIAHSSPTITRTALEPKTPPQLPTLVSISTQPKLMQKFLLFFNQILNYLKLRIANFF